MKKVKAIIKLDGENVPAAEIAKQLGVNTATVYRQLRQKHGKRRAGRKPKAKASRQEQLDIPKAE